MSRSSKAAVSLDLPMPASPESRTTWPSPAFAFAQRRSNSSLSSSRPTRVGQPARVQRLEPAFLRTLAESRIGARRPGDALELLRAEVAELEQVAEQPTRALGDDDAVGRGDRLQPRGEVWRVADDASLLRLPRTQEIADDHDSGRDAHAHMQRRARGRHRASARRPRSRVPALTARSASCSCACG